MNQEIQKWNKFNVFNWCRWGGCLLALSLMVVNRQSSAETKGSSHESVETMDPSEAKKGPRKGVKQVLRLSDYVLKEEAFKALGDQEKLDYLAFMARFNYNIEKIQNAPQDHFFYGEQESSSSADARMESWWKLLGGENAHASSEVKDQSRISSCRPPGKQQGTSCLFAGHLSSFILEVKNGVTTEVCRPPQQMGDCGEGKVKCDTLGMAEIFRLVDKYNLRHQSKSVCVPLYPRNQVAERCGGAFAKWRKENLGKLSSTKDYRIQTSTGKASENDKRDFSARYFTLLVYYQGILECSQDKVERCQSIQQMNRGTFGNGGYWKYDAQTNTSTVTFPGRSGYASFQGKPKGGTFSGQQVDIEFQRSECNQVLAAHRDIQSEWEKVPLIVKNWVDRNNRGRAIPVRDGQPGKNRQPSQGVGA